MKTVIKNKGKVVKAYRLGSDSPEISALIADGKIVCREDGRFEVMSQEAVNGNSGIGQIAEKGDYIKIDSSGFPYPNSTSFFEKNHKHIDGCTYEQIPKPLAAWMFGDPMCDEILFLTHHKGLVIPPNDYEHYFTAPLYGTLESAARDSVIIFYSITMNDACEIADADFNFVVRNEFDKTYTVLED